MIKIRKSCFETNSSSTDRYEDYDNAPDHGYAHQISYVVLKWKPNISEDTINSVLDKISNSLSDSISEVAKEMYSEARDVELEDAYDEYLVFTGLVTVKVHYEGSSSPATMYDPPEYPELCIDDIDGGIPLKGEDFPDKQYYIDQFMKWFKKHNIDEIIGISDIYGDDIDDDEVADNLSY